MDIKSKYRRECFTGFRSRMLRGFQPTIRPVVSDFGGFGRSRFVGRRIRLPLALMPAAASMTIEALGDCPVASCSAPFVRCDICRPKRKSLAPAASRRPPWGGEAIERRPASLTSGVCSPEPAASTINSRLPKNVIAGRLRPGHFPTALSGACSVFVLSACPLARKAVKRLGREVWHLST